jgi:hypothetical protein
MKREAQITTVGDTQEQAHALFEIMLVSYRGDVGGDAM